MQAQCHRELEQLGSASVSLKDMDRLLYCQATVLVTHRIQSVLQPTTMAKLSPAKVKLQQEEMASKRNRVLAEVG